MTERQTELCRLLGLARDSLITKTEETTLLKELKNIAIHVMLKKGVCKQDYDDVIQEFYYHIYRRLNCFDQTKCRNPANWVASMGWNSIRQNRTYHYRWEPTENDEIDLKIEQRQEERHARLILW